MKVGAIFISAVVGLLGAAAWTAISAFVRWAWPASPTDVFAILFTGILAAIVGIVAVIAAVWGTFSARKIARSQATLEHLTDMESNASFQAAKQVFNQIRHTDLTVYADAEKEGSDNLEAIITVLNEYELMSVGIQRGIIDGELYKRLSRSTVIFDWESSQPFVIALRKRTARPSLFHEFEEMAGWMSQNRLPHRRFWWAGL